MTDIGLGLAGAELPEQGGDEGWWDPMIAVLLAAFAGFVGISCYSSHQKGNRYKCAIHLLP